MSFMRSLSPLLFPSFVFIAVMSDPKPSSAETKGVMLAGVDRPKPDCSIAVTAMEAVSSIRRLKVLTQVPCRLQARDEVESYLRETIKRKIPDQRIENEGRVYKLLGLIPPEYDYLNGIVSLYTEQLGGYYDPDLNYYAMASWMPAVMQMSIAVHELTHALQDQHFDLGRLMDNNKETSDALMARSALAEGDATAVMIDYERERVGHPPLSDESSIAGFMMENIAGAMISPSVQKVPSALRHLLIFPYVGGLRFAHTLLQRGGYAQLDKAFHAPPLSTAQVLHPEKFLNGDPSFRDLPVPKPPSGAEAKPKDLLYSDRLGEFVISALIGSYLPPLRASEAAAGWDGDKLALYPSARSKFGVLVWDTEWESDNDAKQFFDALRDAYIVRFGRTEQQSDAFATFDAKEMGTLSLSRKRRTVKVEVR